MLFNLTNLSSEPVHCQLSKQLLQKILADDYYDGTRLPPARMLASEQHVNVNTVERAYRMLCEDELIQGNAKGEYRICRFSAEERERLRLKHFSENNSLNAIEDFSKRLFSVFDPAKLLEIFSDFLQTELGVRKIVFLMRRQSVRSWELIENAGEDQKISGYPENVISEIRIDFNSLMPVSNATEFIKDPRLSDVLNREAIRFMIPLQKENTLYGFLCLTERENGRQYSENDSEFIKILSYQLLAAMDAAGFFKEAMEKRRMEEELKIAREIQADLLPRELPENEYVEMAAYIRPSQMFGGDYYDVLPIDENRVAVVVADACGKGLPAAMMISQVHALIRNELKNNCDIESLLSNVNSQLITYIPRNRFITLFLGIFDSRNQSFRYAAAGHHHPVLVSKDRNIRLLSAGGPALGLTPDAVFQSGYLKLHPGDLLCLYSDGIVETMNPDFLEFGEERLEQLLLQNRDISPADLVSLVIDKVEEYIADPECRDDRTLLILKIKEKINQPVAQLCC